MANKKNILSKKSIIAIIIIIVLLFIASLSVGIFLANKGDTEATAENQTTDENQTEDNEQSDDTAKTDSDNDSKENQDFETIDNNDNDNNKNETSNNETNNDDNSMNITTGTNIDEIKDSTLTRIEEQEKIVSKDYWDWWIPTNVAVASVAENIIPTTPDFTVKKSVITGVGGDKFAYAGQDITYVITIINNGKTDLNNIEITDKIPENTTLVSINDDINPVKGEIITTNIDGKDEIVGVKWIASIPGHKEDEEAKFIKLKLTVNINETMIVEDEDGVKKEVPTTGTIENIAVANGEESNGGEPTKISIISAKKSSILMRKDSNGEYYEILENQKTAKIGDRVKYTITVSNTGDLEGSTYITDNIPVGTKLISIDGKEVTEQQTTVEWFITLGAKGTETETISKEFVVEIIDIDGKIENIADVGGNPTNKDEIETGNIEVIKTVSQIETKVNGEKVIISNPEDLKLFKVKEGDIIEYNITITNTGSLDLTNIVADEKLEGLKVELLLIDNKPTTIKKDDEGRLIIGNLRAAKEGTETSNPIPAGVATIIATYEVTYEKDIQNNPTKMVYNQVIAIGTTVPTDPTKNPEEVKDKDNTNTPVENIQSIDIEKTATAVKEKDSTEFKQITDITKVRPGDIIEYRIEVTNTGNTELKNIKVTDSLKVTVNGEEKELEQQDDGSFASVIAIIPTLSPEIGKNTEVINVYYTVVEEDVKDSNPIYNLAKAIVPNGPSDSDNENVPVNPDIKLTVNKIWEDIGNEEKRPKEIVIVLKDNENKIIKEKNISGTTNKWTYTFEQLPKYDKNGQEIKYTVDEKEVNQGDLDLYIKNINGTTITNTLKQPKINATKTGKTNTGREIVQIGDKITYTITISNTGNIGKEVKIGDQIPEHTKLIGNIKLDGNVLNEKQEQDFYNNELKIYIEENKTIEITFEVEVISGNAGQNIINIANVDDKKVGPVINPIEKIVEVTKFKNNIASTNIVLVLDVSSSMTRYPNNEYDAPVGKRRIDIAKKALIDFINKTYEVKKNEDVTFTLITFSNRQDTKLFKFNGNQFIATKETKNQFISAIEKITTGNGTNMRAGLEYAYDALYGKNGIKNINKYKEYDSILIFFGDGEPYGESQINNNAKGIKEQADKIRNKGTKLYSIGFGPDVRPGQIGYDRLSDIADDGKVYNSESYENLVDDFSKIIGADPIYNEITIDGSAIIKIEEKDQKIVVDEENAIIIKIDGKEIKITNKEEALKNNITYSEKELQWDVSGYEEVSKLEISYHVE